MSYIPPNPNGSATSANSSPVVVASDQSAIPTFLSDPTSLTKATISATGSLSVGLPATTVFNDSLNGAVIDVTNRWNVPVLAGSGTVTQNGTSGLIFTVSTTANNAGQISTQPTFDISGAIQYIFALGVQLEITTIATGNHRFWGLANQGTSYSTTNPIKEGVGFEVTTAGVLRAVIYSADAVTFSQNLTIPVDGAEHLYGVFFLGNYIFWYIDQFSIPVAVSGLLQPSNTILPIRLHSLNAGAPTVGTPTLNAFSMAIVDSTRNGTNITDGTYGWRKATVSANGELSVKSTGIPTTLGQQAAATSQPVALANEDVQDLYFTGQAAQTATVNNIIPVAVSANATDLTGYRSASVQIICPAGTYTTGAIIFEGSNDNSNFVTLPVWNQLILTGTPITAAITLVTTTFIVYTFPVTTRYVRVRISTAVSGASASVQAISKFSQTSWSPTIYQIAQATAANLATTATIASGTVTTVSTLTGTTTLTPGTAAANLGKAEDAVSASGDTGVFVLGVRRDAAVASASATGDYNEIATNKWGAILKAGYELTAKTFSCSANITVAASATDIAILPGNATNTAYVTKVIISGIQTTAGSVLVQLIKRSSANSGGTSAAMTAIPHDSGDAAAVSAPLSYTANPTPGASVGNIRTQYLELGSATAIANELKWEFGDKGKQVVLSGTAQGLAINLNGVTVTGGVINVTFEWLEL